MEENQNAALWFVDRHIAEGRDAKPAFREVGESTAQLTYGQLAAETDRMAGAFARTGIMREERVACILLDRVSYPVVFWGGLKSGVVPIALNTLLATTVYDAILRDSRAVCLFVSAELLPVVLPATQGNPYLRHIVVEGGAAPEGCVTLAEFTEGASPVAAVQAGADECAFWLYSSGSTGRPKGVRHVHGALRATAETYGAHVLQMREDDIVYSVAKIFFCLWAWQCDDVSHVGRGNHTALRGSSHARSCGRYPARTCAHDLLRGAHALCRHHRASGAPRRAARRHALLHLGRRGFARGGRPEMETSLGRGYP